jgi:hypothetical protein
MIRILSENYPLSLPAATPSRVWAFGWMGDGNMIK